MFKKLFLAALLIAFTMMLTINISSAGDEVIEAPIVGDYYLYLKYDGKTYIYGGTSVIELTKKEGEPNELYVKIYVAKKQDPDTKELIVTDYILALSYKPFKPAFAFMLSAEHAIIDSNCDGMWELLNTDIELYIPECIIKRDGETN